MPRATPSARFVQRLFGEREQRLTNQQEDLFWHWGEHPWNYLTGVDETGRALVWTKDEANKVATVRPWPGHRLYLRDYLDVLLDWDREDGRLILVDKARQMMLTTVTLFYAHWDCMFHDARRWLLSKNKEEEAADLLRDKIRFPYRRVPEWLRLYRPIRPRPATRVDYPVTDSTIKAVAQNVAESEARGGSATGFILDEAARQSTYEEILSATSAMAGQVIALTTAAFGTPGGVVFARQLEEAAKTGTEDRTGPWAQGAR